MPSRIPLWRWIQGKGVSLVRSLHDAVVFFGCGDSLRTGRRVLSCSARELSRSCLHPGLHKREEWASPWSTEIHHIRVEDTSYKRSGQMASWADAKN